ncbi:hypothetical protein [Thalassospira xiamenensis]|uniref:Uncharacterized protein n=1 Tax=Thalassospira xiamenensis TaxID=220697 RepID=A0A285TY91_9PROT|nr:hypothetical protein [Thalassospira xiamenensis]SOC31400.1 hypothetical protein SAMN05428964_1173 [Thalassospira xiamenensis]
MTPDEIGMVFSALMRFRVISNGAFPSARKQDLERRAATILDDAHGRFQDLTEFLETQGLRMDVRELSDYGLGIGSCYILMRSPRFDVPDHISSDHVMKELSAGRIGSDTIETATAWASFMFLIMMWFLYTRPNRGIEQVSGFDDAILGELDFAEEVETRIEQLRSSGGSSRESDDRTKEAKAVWEILTSSKGKIETRASSFLSGMVKLGFLEAAQEMEGYYRQTFASALDIAENFTAYAGGLIHPILMQASEEDVAALIYEGAPGAEGASAEDIFAEQGAE